MEKVPGLFELQPVKLSNLDSAKTTEGEITAVVTLLWPYSRSALKLTALISDPDYSKRETRGELKVSFVGHAAEALQNISIGNVLKLSLEGAKWEPLSGGEEKDVPWHLTWEKQLRVKVFKNTSTLEPHIEINKTFSKARVSDVFERIAASQSLLEDDLEYDEEIRTSTPPKPTASQPGSWPASFFSGAAAPQPTPYRIFSQGRRRLYGTESEDDDDDLESERITKKPRLFEPSQSFRYVADSPPEGESEILPVLDANDSFFDENSIDASFTMGTEPARRLFVRRDESIEPIESETVVPTIPSRPPASPLYVRRDVTKEDTARISNTAHSQTSNIVTASLTQSTETNLGPSIPSPVLSTLTRQKSGTPSRVPLAPKADSAKNSPLHVSSIPSGESLLPSPPLLSAVEAESQPMSSFALESVETQPALQPLSVDMPPPVLFRGLPLLDTSSQSENNPITPVLRPAYSPALPLPSPFPTSALERGIGSYFPSQLSEDITASISTTNAIKQEEESGTLDGLSVQNESVLPKLETEDSIKQEDSLKILEDAFLRTEAEFTHNEDVSALERPEVLLGADISDPVAVIQTETTLIKVEESQTMPSSVQQVPEVISLLDDSDEEELYQSDEDERMEGAHEMVSEEGEEDALYDEEEEGDEEGGDELEEEEEEQADEDSEVEEEEEIEVEEVYNRQEHEQLVESDAEVEAESSEDTQDQASTEITRAVAVLEQQVTVEDNRDGLEEELDSDEDEEDIRIRNQIEYAEMEEFETRRPPRIEAVESPSNDKLSKANSSSKVGLSPAFFRRPDSHVSPSHRTRADQTPEIVSSSIIYGTTGEPLYEAARTASTALQALQKSPRAIGSMHMPAETPNKFTRVPISGSGAKKPRILPWLSSPGWQQDTPHRTVPIPPPQTVPQVAGELPRRPTSEQKAREYGARIQPLLQKLAIREQENFAQLERLKLRRYNAKSTIKAGLITSLSEFTALSELRLEQTVDILAVNLREAIIRRGEKAPRFYYTTLRIIDPSCEDSFSILISRPYKKAMPLTKPGDILLLRSIKIKTANRKLVGQSTLSSAWTVWRPSRALDGSQILVEASDDGPKPEYGKEETDFVNTLWEWWKGIDVDTRVYLINRDTEKEVSKSK